MTVALVPLLVLAGCGRVGFELASDAPADPGLDDVVFVRHDEDFDGVPDDSDTCPHLATASQDDGDGDGVGDACDPNPTVNRDTIALFATMEPGQRPLVIEPAGNATVTLLPDSIRFDGALPGGADNNLHGAVDMPLVAGDVRVAIGFDILAVLPGASGQNQFALKVLAGVPHYFVELNQILPTYDNAEVTYYDGVNYFQQDPQDLANGIHPGLVFMQTTQRVNTGVRLDLSWPGEPYTSEVMNNVYQGATDMAFNFNNLHIELRWLVVITSS